MRLRLRLDRGSCLSGGLFAEGGVLRKELARAIKGLTLSHCTEPISAQHLEVRPVLCQVPVHRHS